MNTAEGLIRELPQGLIRWYEFREHEEVNKNGYNSVA